MGTTENEKRAILQERLKESSLIRNESSYGYGKNKKSEINKNSYSTTF